jgi:putative transposase
VRKSNFTEEPIIKNVGSGQKITNTCRAIGINEQTYHRWKARYGALEINGMRRLKQLEQENLHLK